MRWLSVEQAADEYIAERVPHGCRRNFGLVGLLQAQKPAPYTSCPGVSAANPR